MGEIRNYYLIDSGQAVVLGTMPWGNESQKRWRLFGNAEATNIW